MVESDDKVLGQALKSLSESHGTPVDQGTELTGLLARVEETEGIPESLVVVLSRVLEFLYQEETQTGDEAGSGD